MSYVQGTKVRVIGEFKDPDTQVLEDPAGVVVTIYPPDDSATIIRQYGQGLEVGKIADGIYQTVIDTTSAAGEWVYTFEGEGDDAVVKTGRLRVRPRPPSNP